MHRLFWKLYLSFWLAMMVFAGAAVLGASLYVDRARVGRPIQRLEARIAEAQSVADAGAIEGLLAWARRIDDSELVPLLVLDRDGHDLLNRDVSPSAAARLQRRLQPTWSDFRVPRSPAELRPIRLMDGREFWLIPDFQGATLSRLVSRPQIIVFELTIAIIIGALASYILARYLTSPIEQLRNATLAYAAGDFRRRVMPTLGRRRDEIADLAAAQDYMAEKIEGLIRAQQSLLRDVSHELRSPLGRAVTAIGLARQRLRDTAGGDLDRIEREFDRLNDLIGQILVFSRLDSGVHLPKPEPLALRQFVADLIEDGKVEADKKNCRIRLVAGHDDMTISGDPVLLQSACENVLQNAVRHAPAGSEIVVELLQHNDECVVRIADRGAGVPTDMLERIFDPFIRVEGSRSPATGGVGLGLAIARRAVQAHGGTIVAENLPAGGFAVSITLPRIAHQQA